MDGALSSKMFGDRAKLERDSLAHLAKLNASARTGTRRKLALVRDRQLNANAARPHLV